jgi:hypothetical protein
MAEEEAENLCFELKAKYYEINVTKNIFKT